MKNPQTIADGADAVPRRPTFPIIRALVADMATVTDDELIATMKFVWSG